MDRLGKIWRERVEATGIGNQRTEAALKKVGRQLGRRVGWWVVLVVVGLVALYPHVSQYKGRASQRDQLGSFYYGLYHDPVAARRGGDTSGTGEREAAAVVALVRNSELAEMRSSVRQLEYRWNHKYNYPYVFFNDEPFTEEFKAGIRELTRSEVTFVQLDEAYWSVPESIDLIQLMVNLQRNRRRYIYGGKLSYRFMCRFEAMLFYDHPAMRSYAYYWRIEPDVDYFCQLNYDPFRFMRLNNLTYGFTIAFAEIKSTIETLWDTTLQWVAQNHALLPPDTAADWLLSPDGQYNGCHFWSNFEIVALDFYRSPAYQSYVRHLDAAGGFFYERWGDAPIHSIAASLLLPRRSIFWFEDIGYRHSKTQLCPLGFDMAYNCYCSQVGSHQKSMCHSCWNDAKGLSRQQLLDRLPL